MKKHEKPVEADSPDEWVNEKDSSTSKERAREQANEEEIVADPDGARRHINTGAA